MDGEKLQAILKQLLSEHNIFRAKGFAALPGKPMRQVLQAVGQRLDVSFDRLWTADDNRRTSLVFIGKGITEALLVDALKQAELATA